MKKIRFDEGIEQLEAIIDKLELGDAGLEESVKLYEKGMTLVTNCQKLLQEAEEKIDVLNEQTGGELILEQVLLDADPEAET